MGVWCWEVGEEEWGVGTGPSEAPGWKGVDLTSGFGPGQPRAVTAVMCVEATAPALPLGVRGSDFGGVHMCA